jgi:hypothetical protein
MLRMSDTLKVGYGNDKRGIGTVSRSIGWVNGIPTLKFKSSVCGELGNVDCILDC